MEKITETETPLQELDRLVGRCEKHQKALGLSDNAFSIKYKDFVGSAKTWRSRLCTRDFSGLRLERILGKLRAMVSLIDGGANVEQVFDDLPVFRQFVGRYNKLQSARTDRRVMVFLGETGIGKSVCARAALRADPANTAYVRCQPTWKDNQLAILNGILKALGKDEYLRKSRAFAAVLEYLKSNPITVIFDEAHDGGVALLKLAKSFVDETNCKFVIMAYPTLWKRMLLASSDAHAEARQLFGARRSRFSTHTQTARRLKTSKPTCAARPRSTVARKTLPARYWKSCATTATCGSSPTSSTPPTAFIWRVRTTSTARP